MDHTQDGYDVELLAAAARTLAQARQEARQADADRAAQHLAKQIHASHGDGAAALAAARTTQYGFLTSAQVEVIASDPATRLTPMLVRCGGCRFTCAAQDVAHLAAIIRRDAERTSANDGGDYVRDVSLPVDAR